MDWSTCVENGVATLRCIPVAINGVVNASMILAGVAAIFFIILSGIRLLLSGGDQVQVEKAKKTFSFAILGLVIISLAFVIVNFVGSRLNFRPIGLVTTVYASSHCAANPEYLTDFGCLPETPAQFGSAVYNIGLGFIGAVALLFIVYGGYLILTSQGSSEQLAKGKSYIFYAIAGIILAVSGFALYQTVATDVLKIPGFNK